MKYYVIYNRNGINCSSDSVGWSVYVFNSLYERKQWLSQYELHGDKYVAEAATVRYLRKNFGRERSQQNEYKLPCFGKMQSLRPEDMRY